MIILIRSWGSQPKPVPKPDRTVKIGIPTNFATNSFRVTKCNKLELSGEALLAGRFRAGNRRSGPDFGRSLRGSAFRPAEGRPEGRL